MYQQLQAICSLQLRMQLRHRAGDLLAEVCKIIQWHHLWNLRIRRLLRTTLCSRDSLVLSRVTRSGVKGRRNGIKSSLRLSLGRKHLLVAIL